MSDEAPKESLPNSHPSHPRSFQFRDIPIWLSGVGTIAIAAIGFYTLAPVIENLELRERNRELTITNKDLQANIENSKRVQERLNSEIQFLTSNAKTLREEAEKLSKRQDQLTQALTQISGNIGQQVTRERDLTTNIEKLRSQTRELESNRNQLELENKKLQFATQEIERRLKISEAEQKRVASALAETFRRNRRFILTEIVTKAKIQTPPIKDSMLSRLPEKLPEIAVLAFGKFDVPFAGWHTYEETTKRLPAFGSVFGPFEEGLFAEALPISKELGLNGRQILNELLETKTFEILDDERRKAYKQEILKYLENNLKKLELPLRQDGKFTPRLWTAIAKVAITKGSRYVGGALKSKNTEEEVPENEVTKRDEELKNAQDDYNRHLKIIKANRELLYEFLDSMLRELP